MLIRPRRREASTDINISMHWPANYRWGRTVLCNRTDFTNSVEIRGLRCYANWMQTWHIITEHAIKAPASRWPNTRGTFHSDMKGERLSALLLYSHYHQNTDDYRDTWVQVSGVGIQLFTGLPNCFPKQKGLGLDLAQLLPKLPLLGTSLPKLHLKWPLQWKYAKIVVFFTYLHEFNQKIKHSSQTTCRTYI